MYNQRPIYLLMIVFIYRAQYGKEIFYRQSI